MSDKEEFKLVEGKNGIHFIRRRNGDALMMFMWNTRGQDKHTGEPEFDNEITERIYHLLRLAGDRSIGDLRAAKTLLLLHQVSESEILEQK